MKISELIKKLEQLPDETDVFVYDESGAVEKNITTLYDENMVGLVINK